MGRFYILTQAGEFERLDFPGELKGTPVNFTPALMDSLRVNVPVWLRNISTGTEDNFISVCLANKMTFISKRLSRIKIRANYKTDQEKKLVVPDWGNTACPEFAIEWTPPPGMTVRLGVEVSNDQTITGVDPKNPQAVILYRAYLIAHNDAKACFKLPMPNLYDDLRICLPLDIVKKYNASLEAFEKVAQVVSDSLWNNHLIHARPTELENTPSLFRFEPNGEGFKTLAPLDKKWERFCVSAGTTTLQYMMP